MVKSVERRVAPPFDDPIAASLRGFGPLGLLAILLIVLTYVFKPLGAILVLVWAWRSHTPWREIGYVRPKELAWQSGRRHRFRLRVETPYEGDRHARCSAPPQSIPPTITWQKTGLHSPEWYSR